jgi:integrase
MPRSHRRGRSEGSVYKRSDGRWAGSVSLGWQDGKRLRKTFYGENQRAVLDLIAAARARLQAGLPIDAPEPAPAPASAQTTAQFLEWWLANVVRISDVKPRTREGYAIIIRRHVAPKIGAVPIADLTGQHIADLLTAKEAEGLASLTRRHIRTVLKYALTWAVDEGLMKGNPVGKRTPPPRLVQRPAVFLTVEQAQRLIEVAQDDRLGALHIAALFTGMRKGELLALRWTDLNLDARTLEVTRTMQRVSRGAGGTGLTFDTPKTESSRRAIHLADEVVTALRAHRAQQARERLAAGALWNDHGGLVFTTLSGSPVDPSHLHTAWKALLKTAGLPDMHFHDLRHSAASLALHHGATMVDVKNLLGHSSIKITVDAYTHAYPAAGRALADKMSAALGKK